jgi:hypothetical protein
METEVSLPCSQHLPLDPALNQINLVHIIPSYLSKINFNVILPPMLGTR